MSPTLKSTVTLGKIWDELTDVRQILTRAADFND